MIESMWSVYSEAVNGGENKSLILWQSSCTEDQLSSLMAGTDLTEAEDNRMMYPSPPVQRQVPNVIDNLHGYDSYDDSDPTG